LFDAIPYAKGGSAVKTLRMVLVTIVVFSGGFLVFTKAVFGGEQDAIWMTSFQKGVRALKEKEFEEAIGQFKKAIHEKPDATQPYSAIRIAYGQMGLEHSPSDMLDLVKARKVLDGGQLDHAEEILRNLLRVHFANPQTHALLRRVYMQKGRSEEASHELKIFSGLLDAILSTGDGKTPETSFLVQSISEEYVVALRLNCENKGHELRKIKGRMYDVLTLSCGRWWWNRRTVYFDISAFYSGDPSVRLTVYHYDHQ
jgi:tetratricopeptide (TPR) repeat protein